MSTTKSDEHKGLRQEELQALAAEGVVRAYPAKSIVVYEGDETDAVYIIVEGRVKVFVADEDGRELTLNVQGPGEYFGEIALDGEPRSASVMTTEPSRLAVIPRERFRHFIESHPGFAGHLIENLIGRVRALTRNVKSLALMDVYGRVARLLLDLAVEADGRLVVPEKLTQQDIATRIGASPDMIGRIMKDLTAGGYISVERQRITIHRTPPRHW